MISSRNSSFVSAALFLVGGCASHASDEPVSEAASAGYIASTGLIRSDLDPQLASCLAVESDENFAPVVLVPCNPGDERQQWQEEYASDWGTVIHNLHSGKCMDALDWGTSNGTAIVQYDCHGGDNQIWVAYRDLCLNDTIYTGKEYTFPLVPKHTLKRDKSGSFCNHAQENAKCMDVWGGVIVYGDGVKLFDCHGGNNQSWTTEWRKYSVIPDWRRLP